MIPKKKRVTNTQYKSKHSRSIGKRIRQIRKERGLTQKDFAISIGISQNYLSQIESDTFKPSKPLLISIEYKFGVAVKWLLSGKGRKKLKKNPLNLKKKKDVSEVLRKLRLTCEDDPEKWEAMKRAIHLILN